MAYPTRRSGRRFWRPAIIPIMVVLIDCGDGRRLERFGEVIGDRPDPVAFAPRRSRRDRWAPAVLAVESALAMFTEITRIRPACARRPDVAMLIERMKSLESFAMLIGLRP